MYKCSNASTLFGFAVAAPWLLRGTSNAFPEMLCNPANATSHPPEGNLNQVPLH